jgi:predicted nuclease of restriction endonuclease-like RecB superfamily
LLPEADLPLRVEGRDAFFDFLGPQDEPWLRVLLGELARFEGRRRRELAERLAEPLPCETPYFKRRAATRVLFGLWRRERVAALPPVEARARLFRAAGAAEAARDEHLARVAASFEVEPRVLLESLFADLPGERVVRAPEPPPAVAEVVLRTNLAVVQAALQRASTIELRVEGGVRPLVRLAKLRGLLCLAVEPQRLQLSGPFSLFRHTRRLVCALRAARGVLAARAHRRRARRERRPHLPRRAARALRQQARGALRP